VGVGVGVGVGLGVGVGVGVGVDLGVQVGRLKAVLVQCKRLRWHIDTIKGRDHLGANLKKCLN